MKLVEILAEEMETWPEGISHLTQSSIDREIYDARDGKEEDSVGSLNPRFDTRRSHSEEKNYPIVTRAQWQAERDKQDGVNLSEAKTDQIDGPIKWRDTIIHCQAIIEDCEREIQRNVDLLDAEGLMMQTDSKKAMQHYAQDVDMSDWRNWKAGDILRTTSSEYEFSSGEMVRLLEISTDRGSTRCEYLDSRDYWHVPADHLEFIARA